MHPRYLRSLVRSSDFTPRVFVAMSFEPRFRARFDNVIAPAIRSLSIGDTVLEPHGVETEKISDSIIAEIVEGITNDIMIIADITTAGWHEGKPIRNGNVMYELGLAHAIRRPEHVLILRSDEDPILFDVSGIRVLSYNPDERPDEAREQVTNAVADSLRFSQRLDTWTVEHAARSLDRLSFLLLMRIAKMPNTVPAFEDLDMVFRNVQYQPNLLRLFDLELVEMRAVKRMSADSPPMTVDQLTDVEVTRLGHEVVWLTLHRTGVWEAFASEHDGIARGYQEWLRRHPDHVTST